MRYVCSSCGKVIDRPRHCPYCKQAPAKSSSGRNGSTRQHRKTRLRIFEFDDWTCQSPGCDYRDESETGEGLHLDHKVPVAKGGTDDDSNLQTLCAPCNLSKGDRLRGRGKGTAALVILCGLPGSGKSTASTKVTTAGLARVSVDDCRARVGLSSRDQTVTDEAFTLAYDLAGSSLADGTHVLFDSTAVSRRARDSLRNLARRYHSDVYLARFPLTYKQLVDRNRARPRADRVPMEKLERMYDDFRRFRPEREKFKATRDVHGATELEAALVGWGLTPES